MLVLLIVTMFFGGIPNVKALAITQSTVSSQLNSLFYFNYGSLDQRLHEFGYKESEQLVKYLKEEFNKNIHIINKTINKTVYRFCY